jgi:hypothetical protein
MIFGAAGLVNAECGIRNAEEGLATNYTNYTNYTNLLNPVYSFLVFLFCGFGV